MMIDFSIIWLDLHEFGYLRHGRSHCVNRLINGIIQYFFFPVANQTNSRVSVILATSSDCKLSFVAG
jgi:hypothetical protein